MGFPGEGPLPETKTKKQMNTEVPATAKVFDLVVPHPRNNYKPRALSHKSLALYAALLIGVRAVIMFAPPFVAQSDAAPLALNAVNVISLTNQSRVGFNEQPVTESAILDQAAQAKAEDMLQYQYFSHTSPLGVTPWDFIRGAGFNYSIAGENLALNYTTSDGVASAWMSSPEHKANILNNDFQNIGVGIAQGQYMGAPSTFVVQMFATPGVQNYTPLASPTKVSDSLMAPSVAEAAIAMPSIEAVQSASGTSTIKKVPSAALKRTSTRNAAPKKTVSHTHKAAPLNVAAAVTAAAAPAGTSVVEASAFITPVQSSALATPSIANLGNYITNKNTLTITGSAPNAVSAYVLVNSVPTVKLPVQQGVFLGDVPLVENKNSIQVVSYDAKGNNSAFSDPAIVESKTVAPTVVSQTMTPVITNDGQHYLHLVLQTAGTPVVVIASLSGSAVVLQPSATPGEWTGDIPISSVMNQSGPLDSSATINVLEQDMAGNIQVTPIAGIQNSIQQQYGFLAQPQDPQLAIFGHAVNERSLKFFFGYMAVWLLVLLTVAIGVKRNIQHLPMIAYTSALVVCALVMFLH